MLMFSNNLGLRVLPMTVVYSMMILYFEYALIGEGVKSNIFFNFYNIFL